MATAVDERPLTSTRTPFTEEQERAVDTRNISVALSAGAGCGKTFVLTERFLSYLEPPEDDSPPCELSELVAITFTERAAREMRDRIRAKCFERLRQAPPEQGEHWLQLLRSLDSARVSTIHSFCGSLLRSNAVEAELDPRFTVLEPSQAETLLAELIDDLLRTKLAAREEAVLELVAQFGLVQLRENLANLLDRCRSSDYRRWLTRQPQELVDAWAEFHKRQALPALVNQLVGGQAALALLAVLRENTFEHAEVRDRQEIILRLLPRLAESSNVAADLDTIRELAKVVRSKKAWPSDEVYEQFRDAAKELRDEIDKLRGLIEFDAAAALSSAQAGLALLTLADELDGMYRSAKSEQALLDFDDLLLRARRLLTDDRHSGLRRRLAEHNRLLLVDECQDTDPVQVDLIKALCGEELQQGKLFFVGDYKQSIYRFRGADPRVFRRLEGETPPAGRLPLSRNFRSQPAILHFVNGLFCDALEGGDGESDGRYVPLAPHRVQTYPGPAIEFMWCVEEGESEHQHEIGSENGGKAERAAKNVETCRRREADWIARRICRFLAGEQSDSEPPLLIFDRTSHEPRAVRKADIAILFRSLSDVAYYEEALRSYGVDYYLVGGHAFYAQQEIYDILNLLRSLASTADEVSLAGVLRSPFFSLTDETLFWLAQHERGLWAGLCADRLPPAITEQQRERVKFAAGVLTELRARKDRLPIAALLDEAFNRTGYDAALLGEFLGERKLANLRKLVEQARAFDRGGMMGLSDFIVQLSQFVVRQPREPLAATQPEATDVVRLMTIHQAKGLEFPIVFVPDLARQVNDRSDSADYSDELGPLVRLPKDHEQADAINGRRLHQMINAAEDKAEVIRLLYVATTRAADFLVLSSGAVNPEHVHGPWMELLAERFDLATGCCIGTLPDGYDVPAVRVVMEAPSIGVRPSSTRARVDLEQLADEIEAAAGKLDDDSHVSTADEIPCDGAARRRFSISQLAGMLDESSPWRLLDASDEPAGPAARDAKALGTLVHAVLANMDFHKSEELATEVRRQVDKLSVRDAAIRDESERLLSTFLRSERAAELRQARQVLKEIEFLLAWPIDAAEPSGRYLQGYLDCLYQDAASRWHVLDYKTNQASPAKMAALAAQYEMQMLVYGLAAEQALGEPVAGLTLHFLRTGGEHTFAWDDRARRRAIELVNGAIETQCRADGTVAPLASAAQDVSPFGG